jgi:hypothetical protein
MRIYLFLLTQVSQNRPVPSSLRPLAVAMNLRFEDFSVLSESEGLRTRTRAFYPATWGTSHLPVTLMVSNDMALSSAHARNPFSVAPLAQLVDRVPAYLLPVPPPAPIGTAQGEITML